MSVRETQRKIGDKIVTKKLKEPIPEGCIHIYPEKKVGISLSRSFFELIKELGVERWKKTDEQKYDHPDLPTTLSITDNVLMISIYAEDFDSATGKVHNFMVSGIGKEKSDVLRERFKATTRIKARSSLLIPARYPRVLHLEFDLDEAEIVGKVQSDVRDFFV